MNIGQNIKELRTLKKMTQAELGKKVGVSRTAISSWEVNRTEPSLNDIEKLAEVLGCKRTDLFGSDDIPMDYYFLVADDEKALVEMYRKAPEEIKDFMLRYLNAYHQVKKYSLSDIINVTKDSKDDD